MSLRNLKTIEQRRKFIEKVKKIEFEAIKVYPKGLKEAQYNNCENMIGAVHVPLGIAGPLKIDSHTAGGDYYIPLATTEGALVASVNRGCKAVTQAGGVKVYTENAGITRGPVFKTGGLAESFELKKWLERNFSLLTQTAQATSSHLQLITIFTKIVGMNVYVRFSFETEEAMGMNMATIAADALVKLTEKETGYRCTSLAGNFDADKKPAWLNFILGRGRQVWAEATIERKIVREILKSTPEKINEVAKDKCLLGSAVSGSMGFNAHFANIIAAIFIACGQDAAHITEGSLGITSTEIIGANLYLSVYLPDVVAGVIGGGTRLPSQREALNILGISKVGKGEKADTFAEIVGGAVLAGELSLLASLAEGSLATAHQRLARRT